MCRTWYHGSPRQLDVLQAGSTITPLRHVAEVFSHKPAMVSVDDDGAIQHNGRAAGLLYTIDEVVGDADVYPHPYTTMPAGWEWLTRRDLRLKLVGPIEMVPGELLTDEDVAELLARSTRQGT